MGDDNAIANAPEVMTPENGLKIFQELDALAAKHLEKSKNELTSAFVALNMIREFAYYSFGGYDDWRSYFDDFLDHNGVSRSLGYENLAIVRLAIASGISENEVMGYGLYTIKPFFDRSSPIIEYDRATGEILQISDIVEKLLPEGDCLNTRYGEWVKDMADQGEAPKLVRKRLRDATEGTVISFAPHFKEGKWVGLQCYREYGEENYEEHFILFQEEPNLSDILRLEMFARLKVPKDFIF